VRIVNLSLAGACIETPTRLPEGAAATVEVVTSILWDPLLLRGRVVWSGGAPGAASRAGLRFEHDNPAQALALFEVLGAQAYEI
jgi:hypothetical protein